MSIEKLRLYDFRNIAELDATFSPNINILYGENAQGKTNILEAIFYLISIRPTRASREAELIRHDKPLAYIRGTFKTPRGQVDRQVTLYRNKKKVVKEGEMVKTKRSQLYHPLSAIYFSPEDLSLVKGEPAQRRSFLDQIFLQIRPSQYKFLQNYYRVLSQRNALLKDIRKRVSPASTLDPWDEQLAQLGSALLTYRIEILNKVSNICKDYYKNTLGNKNKVELVYKNSFGDRGDRVNEESFLALLQDRRGQDIARSHTTIGPHRDDVDLFIDDKLAKTFASQGQQRLLALTMRFAQREILKKESGQEPILLLDDLMSELDLYRRKSVLEDQGQQIFISTVDLDLIPEEILGRSKCFLVEGGNIKC